MITKEEARNILLKYDYAPKKEIDNFTVKQLQEIISARFIAKGDMIEVEYGEEDVFHVCSECGTFDTYSSNGDVGWCSECQTVEGNWHYENEEGDIINY